MIASYTSPEVHRISEPVGLDKEIDKIQSLLERKAAWIQKIFGRCTIQSELRLDNRDGKEGRTIEAVFPQVYTSQTGEALNVMPNDNLKAYSFFIVKDPGEFQNYDFSKTQHYIRRNISLVVWYDVRKYAQSSTRPLNEELLLDLYSAFKEYPNFIIEKVYETQKRVFEEFTITSNYRQFMKFPYSAFRIDGVITYPVFPENCQ